VNFVPVSGMNIPTSGASFNRTSGSDPVNYEIRQLIGPTGLNSARVVQLVTRIRW
jgi:hypothetical protein